MKVQPRAYQKGIVACQVCGLVIELPEDDGHVACPRCDASLHARKGHGPGLTWGLLLAAVLAYVPANIMPVMEVHLLGQGDHELTIMGGILDLWREGSYDLASVVFLASVALPCAKFMVLGGLLLSVRWRTRFACRQRARLHRLLELIGYWSMLDVLVVGILGSLVQFQALGEIGPRAGIYLFGVTVVLTMLAAHSFDSRLIWDAAEIDCTTAVPHAGNAEATHRAP